MGNKVWKKLWRFIWHSNSIWSWIANVIIAFVLIKFIIYPGIGLILGTSYPVVAVMSESMDHRLMHPCILFDTSENRCSKTDSSLWEICGKQNRSFNNYEFWKICGPWYEKNLSISKSDFEGYPFSGGFSKGDIMIIRGRKPAEIKAGDILVFQADQAHPIIHRVIKITKQNGKYVYTTKGDHNSRSDPQQPIMEKEISEDRVLGVAGFKIPWLGWIKIKFTDIMSALLR